MSPRALRQPRSALRAWVLAGAALPALVSPLAVATSVRALSAQAQQAGLPLDFSPPEPELHDVLGVSTFLMEDRSLPLVTVYARFTGGYGRFGRETYAAGTALPALLRYGGTKGMRPDSVDRALEHYALQTTFGGGGGGISSTMNTLSEHLTDAVKLWGGLLAEPTFDSTEVEIWRERQLENSRRRTDDVGTLAFSEFNRLLYGDHPIGWQLSPRDLGPERLSRTTVQEMHGRIVCRENLSLGVTGDVDWQGFRPLAEQLVSRLQPCSDSLPASPLPEVRRGSGVFLLANQSEQSVIVMAHPSDVLLADDPSYYAATIANSVLGAGGFSSRLMSRVRSDHGYAYSVSSLWTTPTRHPGIVGATTRTRPENAAAAVKLILETMGELRDSAPSDQEVRAAIDAIVNGFVFAFESPGQIVARTMFYVDQDLPEDWLRRYVGGVQRVTPESVHRAYMDNLRPEEMTVLIVGDTARMDMEALAEVGEVVALPWLRDAGRSVPPPTPGPSAWRRSRH